MTTFQWFASFVFAATIVPPLQQKPIAQEMSPVYPSTFSTAT